MPAFIKTPKDERLWAKAKARVAEEYGLDEEDGEEYWRRVNGIYQQMAGVKKSFIRAHSRIVGAKVVPVQAHNDKRTKAPADAPAPGRLKNLVKQVRRAVSFCLCDAQLLGDARLRVPV